MSGSRDSSCVGRFRLPAQCENDARSLGVRLRRMLLDETTGLAAVAAKIDGAPHEYQAIPGVREDALQLVQNLKRVRVSPSRASRTDKPLRGLLDSSSSEVRAGEIAIEGAEVANPDSVVAHLSPGARLRVEIAFERGTGRQGACAAPAGWIPLDAGARPVKRVGAKPADDTLEIEIETDRTVSPESALGDALAALGENRSYEPVPAEPPKPAPKVKLGPEFYGDPFAGFEPPPVLDAARESYRRFLEEGIPKLLDRLFPLVGVEIDQYRKLQTEGRKAEWSRRIELVSHTLRMPDSTPQECVRNHQTYQARLILKARVLRTEEDGIFGSSHPDAVEEREIDMGPIPLMTEDAAFVINGGRRCTVMSRNEGYRVLRVGDFLVRQLEALIDQMKPILEDRVSASGWLKADMVQLLPFSATICDFLSSSSWSQWADETNPLATLTHRMRTSTLQLIRDQSEPTRDIRPTDFGRLCYLETPEGPNIGFINTMCPYARVSETGEILTPYRKVAKGKAGKEIVYLSAEEEGSHRIADAADLTPNGCFEHGCAEAGADASGQEATSKHQGADAYASGQEATSKHPGTVLVREDGDIRRVPMSEVDLVSLSPIQALSYSSAMIPFLGHNDPNRSLMASNMLRQALAPIEPEQPLVKSGVEARAARDSGQLVLAGRAGKVVEVTGEGIVVLSDGKRDVYDLGKFVRSNQATCMNQVPAVEPGQAVAVGDVLADAGACKDGELALGRNVLVAYMPFRGLNFEDAICVSDEFVASDAFTSVHIEEEWTEVGDTDVWIAPVGSRVKPGDVLIQEAGGRKRTLLVAPPPNPTVVVGCWRRDGKVKFWLAERRRPGIGDKFTGRNGNKGVIARILPRSQMPHLEDGTPVEMVLNSVGVVSRMNVGQILETHFGLLAHTLGEQFVIPPFMNPSISQLRGALREAGLPETGMMTLYDGATGRPFDSPVTVGYLYIMKLAHLVTDKMAACSTIAPEAVANQPFMRKRNQRLGSLEMWALEAYGASATLQEFMTVKADDAEGRERTALTLLSGGEVEPVGEGRSLEMIENALRGVGISVKEDR